MRGPFLLSAALLLASACSKRDTSPPELDDLCHALVRDFEDPDLVAPHVDLLSAWLDTDGRESAAWDGLLLTNLTQEDLTPPLPGDDDLSLHRGVATAAPSPFSIEAHAGLIVRSDQSWVDPGSFEVYDRVIVEGDPDGFAAGSGVLRTENDIVKNGGFGVQIPYTLTKDFRWVETEAGLRAIVARAWLEEPGCNENGSNCVNQSWGLEAFIAHEDETLRLYAVWLEVVTQADGLLTEDGRISLIAKGNQDIIEGTDAELAK